MSAKKIKIAIADDHTLVCESFAKALEAEKQFKVVGTAPNGLDLIKIIEKKTPDVILLDLHMPVMNGWETMTYLKEKEINCKIVIVSMHFKNILIKDMVKLGARGFLPKNSDFVTLINAIHEVNNSGYYFSKKISKSIVKELLTSEAIDPVYHSVALNEKELETLKLVCADKTTHEIAQGLGLANRTAERYKSILFEKTDTKTTAGLVLFALRNNYISI